ncbi:hypothetical protein ETC01_12085 [Geobacillus sp. NFOSA3]|nr:hypothetical protein [Geobacillus sp. NFOSA3]
MMRKESLSLSAISMMVLSYIDSALLPFRQRTNSVIGIRKFAARKITLCMRISPLSHKTGFSIQRFT